MRAAAPRRPIFEAVRHKRHPIAKLALVFFFVSCGLFVHLCVKGLIVFYVCFVS